MACMIAEASAAAAEAAGESVAVGLDMAPFVAGV